jgi:HD-like signal output (HDOD) protein/signal transduction histidine kinase
VKEKHRAEGKLPSLPQVLLRVLDAIENDEASFERVAESVRQDAAIAIRLIAAANAGRFGRTGACETVERALSFLGTDAVRTIVITAAMQQFFSGFGQRHQDFLKAFWRRSLVCANFAHILANLTGYRAPEQAYLCGLLTDLGQLILLNRFEQAYLDCWRAARNDRALVQAEQDLFGETHAECGADLMERWRIGTFMADAVRYHHEAGDLILDAHHLVKIINLSSALSAPGGLGDHAIAQAGMLFGLNEALTRELSQRVSADIERLADSLSIDIGAPESTDDTSRACAALGQRLGALVQVEQVGGELARTRDLHDLERAIRRAVYMVLGVEKSVLFSVDARAQKLQARLPEEASSPRQPDFVLALEPKRSMVSDALIERRVLDSAEHPVLSVADRQLLRFCASERALCLPLHDEERPVGVLLLGVDAQFALPRPLATALGREIARAVGARHSPSLEQNEAAATDDALQQRVRELVHEAGNPLSIIGNYLEMLRLKLGEQHQAAQDIESIKQEIDRVGEILLRLREPQEAYVGEGGLNLNRLIERLARVFERSIFEVRRLRLDVRLDPAVPMARAEPGHVKQILTNLVKNAAEALDEGGLVVISTVAEVVVGDRHYVAVQVEDDGPGLPPDVQERLFSPVVSGKGGHHAGLGLSITRRLVEQLNGSIMCTSDKTGTRFQILLPK